MNSPHEPPPDDIKQRLRDLIDHPPQALSIHVQPDFTAGVMARIAKQRPHENARWSRSAMSMLATGAAIAVCVSIPLDAVPSVPELSAWYDTSFASSFISGLNFSLDASWFIDAVEACALCAITVILSARQRKVTP